MKGEISLTPDELAKLIGAIMVTNGMSRIQGLSIEADGKPLSFDRAVIHYEADFNDVMVYRKPADGEAMEKLYKQIYPNVDLPNFGTRSGT